jgi:ABC-2 type transport system permease protein
MISVSTIWAITLRHLYVLKHDYNFMLGTLYWPLFDIIMWGYLGTWMQQSSTQLHDYKTTALLGVLLWQVIGRGCNVIITTLAEEFWSRNVTNLFTLPIRISEWICGITIFYSIMLTLTSLFCIGMIYLLYDVHLWHIISTFFIFLPPLLISGLWVGFTCLQVVVTLGRKGAELGFVIAWCLMPFSGAYYPIDVLPAWGQTISTFLPMSYVFKGMREYLMNQQDPTSYLLIAYALSIVYTTIAVAVFTYCFNRSKQKGLARLVD